MEPPTDVRLIVGAWTDAFATFARKTDHELLVMTPWMKYNAALLLAHSLQDRGEVRLNLLARLDDEDFETSRSDLEAFTQSHYPSNVHLEVRALKSLHAKMLVADRARSIVGSANLTAGGLYLNHEIVVEIDSIPFAARCRSFYLSLWELADRIDEAYLDALSSRLDLTLPLPEDEDGGRTAGTRPNQRRGEAGRRKYVKPEGHDAARRQLAQLRRYVVLGAASNEDPAAALDWLESLRFMRAEERRSSAVAGRLERLFYHQDTHLRATAIDRAGRMGLRKSVRRLESLVLTPGEPDQVRSAAAFSLGLIGAPEVFETLEATSVEPTDAGRWSRRACFLMLDVVSEDERSAFLETTGSADPESVMTLVRDLRPQDGSISERLTKALVVEKVACGEWSDCQLDALTLLMWSLSRVLPPKGQWPAYARYVKLCAGVLGVRPGDLRHGPFSVVMLRRRLERGEWSDQGVSQILVKRWQAVESDPASYRHRVEVDCHVAPALELLGQHG